jgi:dTDP-4-dehydrorhamnose reductase
MTAKRKVLITGCRGQVGHLLARHSPAWADVVALDRSQLDLTSEDNIRSIVEQVRPNIIINAAAYTAVDKAETDAEQAQLINGRAVQVLAEEAHKLGAKLVHYSTDYVFDGLASHPYKPDAIRNPRSVYGSTKARGEDFIASTLPKDAFLILRTAWVYAPEGKNFVATMLRLMQSQPHLRVIADQIGTPTAAQNLATATWTALERQVTGIHHYTDAGVASWYDFACIIGQHAHRTGLLSKLPEIHPISTADYPQAATRPQYGVLDKQSFWHATDIKPEHWADALMRTWFHKI